MKSLSQGIQLVLVVDSLAGVAYATDPSGQGGRR